MKKVYVVGGDSAVVKMFINAGFLTITQLDTARNEGFDLLCFTGGEDVSPYLYGEENSASYPNEARDELEVAIYQEFIDKPKVGICRGGQLMNVLNGGKMIQDIKGHGWGLYTIINNNEESPLTFVTKEDHHQGMVLPDNWYEKAWPLYWDSRDGNLEVVYYHKRRDLCFQAHPEWGHNETKKLFFDLIKQYLGMQGE